MSEPEPAWIPTSDDQEILKHALAHIASERGLAGFEVSDTLLAQSAAIMVVPGVVECSGSPRAESANQIGMVIANRKRQLAYTVKLSNFLRDPIPSLTASSLMIFAAFYAPSIIEKLPPTFPAFLISLTFAVLRAFAYPIGYGEAALLHALHRVRGTDGVVPVGEVQHLGAMLVKDYDYFKGENRNEVEVLLRSLVAFAAVERVPGGIKVNELFPLA